MNSLPPCPFCGHSELDETLKAPATSKGVWTFTIICLGCFVVMIGSANDPAIAKKIGIEKWEKRVKS